MLCVSFQPKVYIFEEHKKKNGKKKDEELMGFEKLFLFFLTLRKFVWFSLGFVIDIFIWELFENLWKNFLFNKGIGFFFFLFGASWFVCMKLLVCCIKFIICESCCVCFLNCLYFFRLACVKVSWDAFVNFEVKDCNRLFAACLKFLSRIYWVEFYLFGLQVVLKYSLYFLRWELDVGSIVR